MAETAGKQKQKDPRLVEAREHVHTARKAMRKSFESFLPAGYVENKRLARKEFLMAMRNLVDVAIERVEKAGEK